jgi:hypothetical protein
MIRIWIYIFQNDLSSAGVSTTLAVNIPSIKETSIIAGGPVGIREPVVLSSKGSIESLIGASQRIGELTFRNLRNRRSD